MTALYAYQESAVEFLVTAGSALLGDPMGLGKGPMTVIAAQVLDCYPALVVCPNSMKKTWVREFSKWAPNRTAIALQGTAPQRLKQLAQGADVIVANWDVLRHHSRLAPYGSVASLPAEKIPGPLNEYGFKTVIADEAHRAKTPTAKQTRALWAIGDGAEHRYALTGTPIANAPDDLWGIMRFVAPHEWPSRSKFLDRYCLMSHNYWGGAEVVGLNPAHEAEFRAVFEPRFLRRPKELVLPFLPKKIRERRDVELSPKQAKAYRQLADGYVAEMDNGTLVTFNPLTHGQRLGQVASASLELLDDGSVRMTEPSSKLDAFMEVLEELGPDEHVAVFASSRQLLDLAAVRLDKAAVTYSQVVGGMTEGARTLAIDDYNAGRSRVILISLGAGAEGLSLTRGQTEVFLDRSWSQIQNVQGEDRLHGTGRGEAGSTRLLIIDLVASGTVEQYRADVLQEKSERLEEVVRDRDLLREALTFGRPTKEKK